MRTLILCLSILAPALASAKEDKQAYFFTMPDGSVRTARGKEEALKVYASGGSKAEKVERCNLKQVEVLTKLTVKAKTNTEE